MDHNLGCTCGKCGTVTQFTSEQLEKLYNSNVGEKYIVDCRKCGQVDRVLSQTEKERIAAAKNYSGPTEFVHLHNHTIYSPLDGVAKPEEYFDGCAECKLPAFAITDHGSIAAMPDAYFAAKKNKVKFISGCEIYLNDFNSEFREWQAYSKGETENPPRKNLIGHSKLHTIRADQPEIYQAYIRNRHLTVLCKNMTGYKNLIEINNTAFEKGFYYKPRVWYDLLKSHKEGLIILSGCLNGPVCHELRSDDVAHPVPQSLKRRVRFVDERGFAEPKVIGLNWIKQFQEDFGDDFYLEAQMPGENIKHGKDAFRMISEIGRNLKVKTVITNDCHYLQRDDYEIQLVMMATDQQKKIDDPTLFHVNSNEQFFKTRAQLRKTFIEGKYTEFASINEFEQYCDNTIDIAEKCYTFEPDLTPKLPEVDNADNILIKNCYEALVAKGLRNVPGYYDRLFTELQRITEKKFSSYFLITADVVKESKGRGWPVGPARGSAGGSLVCYLLDIIEIDPIKFDLSFDRFLSASRGGYMLNAKMD